MVFKQVQEFLLDKEITSIPFYVTVMLTGTGRSIEKERLCKEVLTREELGFVNENWIEARREKVKQMTDEYLNSE